MQFKGTVEIAAPRDTVWAFLMDPNQVGSCGPGVESIDVVDEDHFKAKAKVGDRVHLREVQRGHDGRREERPRPRGAQGPRPGAGVGGRRHRQHGALRAAEGPTTMDWSADVLIAGTLASVGARLIEGTANKMIGQTFDCIRSKLEAGWNAPAAPAGGASTGGGRPDGQALADHSARRPFRMNGSSDVERGEGDLFRARACHGAGS